MMKLSRYVLYDILRSKIVIAYTLFLFVVSVSMFQMEEDSSSAMSKLTGGMGGLGGGFPF